MLCVLDVPLPCYAHAGRDQARVVVEAGVLEMRGSMKDRATGSE